jgi:3-oxoacyl-[acyl-carrier-protein] synthase III
MTALDAVASYLPPERVPIDDLADQLGLTPIQVRLFQRVHGLAEVRLDRGGALVDLLRAAVEKLDGLRGREHLVRYVIHGRSMPVAVPYPANPLHELTHGLGLHRAVAFTVTQQACASGLLAVAVAGQLLDALDDPEALALVVTGEKTFCSDARMIPGTTIFGEGAAACLIRARGDHDRLLSTVTHMHGEFDGRITRRPELAAAFQRVYPDLLAQVLRAAVARAGLDLADIGLILPHNVNRVSWRAVCKILGYPIGQVVLDNVPVGGHNFCADAFINYRTAVDQGRLRPGERYLMAAVGSGATFTAMVFEH